MTGQINRPSASLAKMLENAVARQEFDNILGILTQGQFYSSN